MIRNLPGLNGGTTPKWDDTNGIYRGVGNGPAIRPRLKHVCKWFPMTSYVLRQSCDFLTRVLWESQHSLQRNRT